MSKKIKNTVSELDLIDGSTVKVTLAYRYLLELSSKNKVAYNEYNAVFNKKQSQREEIDNIRIVYTAYLCATIMDKTFDQAMTWDQFIDCVTIDRESIQNTVMSLMCPNRKRVSEAPSE